MVAYQNKATMEAAYVPRVDKTVSLAIFSKF